jgi:hypothetical protein
VVCASRLPRALTRGGSTEAGHTQEEKMRRKLWALSTAIIIGALLLTACQPQTIEVVVTQPVEVEVTREVDVEVTREVEVEVTREVEVQATVEVMLGQMRQLSGELTIAVEGAVPVPGAPLTKRQAAWQKMLAIYSQLQPNVTVNLIDLPAGGTGEEFCDTRIASQTMPDISMIGNCDYFRPTPEELAAGTVIAMDWKPFEEEINPYTGFAWKDDWLDDGLRLGRCTEGGLVDMWTCQTTFLELKMIFVNWDILHEFGVTELPTTITGLWELSDMINQDGRYMAWDASFNRWQNFNNNLASMLAMDTWAAIGANPDDLKFRPLSTINDSPDQAIMYCNQTLWITTQPGMAETVRQSQRFMEALGGGEAFFDPTRPEAGTQWLAGRAAFWWDSTEAQPTINQAIEDGTFLVNDWSLTYLPDFTADELIDPNVNISFDGKWIVEYGGQGDVFGVTGNVRESGDDPNVDLLVRDFFQFLSSPLGSQRIVDEGLIPLNPIGFQNAPTPWVNAIEQYVPITAEYYDGTSQPPGGAMIGAHNRNGDPEQNLIALMSGDLEFDDAIARADLSVTREKVRRLNDNLAQWGLTELPPECADYAP